MKRFSEPVRATHWTGIASAIDPWTIQSKSRVPSHSSNLKLRHPLAITNRQRRLAKKRFKKLPHVG